MDLNTSTSALNSILSATRNQCKSLLPLNECVFCLVSQNPKKILINYGTIVTPGDMKRGPFSKSIADCHGRFKDFFRWVDFQRSFPRGIIPPTCESRQFCNSVEGFLFRLAVIQGWRVRDLASPKHLFHLANLPIQLGCWRC
jgi:hypothetical protein